MEKIEIETYTFEELDEKAQEKAMDWYREHALDYDWWETVYEDAKNVGVAIKGFDIERGAYCEIKFIESADATARLILKEHGKTTETYATTLAYLKEVERIDETLEGDELEDIVSDIEKEYEHNLSEDYRIILQREYEYLTSDEQIKESIIANEYSFTKEGKRSVTL